MANTNIPIQHKKHWQPMQPMIGAGGAGTFVISDKKNNYSISVTSATVQYLYSHSQDGWLLLPSAALAGTFGAGACGQYHPWSNTFASNAVGTTTTISVLASTHNITNLVVGKTVEMLTGVAGNIGLRRVITAVSNSGGSGNIIITLNALPNATGSGDTFRINSGRYFVIGAGTVASNIFKSFDLATMSWNSSAYATANLPGTWGTDGRMETASRFELPYVTGTATSATGTTLVKSGATWATNNFCNYQVRITGGTGIGQRRNITTNTGTTLTVPTWTVTPDATSVFAIEGSDDYIYLLGNNAVTMYRYDITANTWAVLAPTTARAGTPTAGMSADLISITGNSIWALESNLQDGRYIYSFRGANGFILERYDISGGTAGAGAWAVVTATINETFTSGSSTFSDNGLIYVKKDATNRFFVFDVAGNVFYPFSTNIFADGTAVIGNKIWVKYLDDAGTTKWIYAQRSSGVELFRCMII